MKNLFFYLFALLLSVNFYSCNKDDNELSKPDDYNEDIGKDNFTDLAVTGGVLQVSTSSCDFLGYININAATSDASKLTFGVEVSRYENFKSPQRLKTTQLLNNREIRIVAKYEFYDDTDYYYRTYVYNGKFYTYGQTLTFKTKKLINASKVENISVKSPVSATITLSKTADSVQTRQDESLYYGIAYTADEEEIQELMAEIKAGSDRAQNTASIIFTCEYTSYSKELLVYDLIPNKTYYYVPVTSIGFRNTFFLDEIKTFKTSSVDEYITVSHKENAGCGKASFTVSLSGDTTQCGDVISKCGIIISKNKKKINEMQTTYNNPDYYYDYNDIVFIRTDNVQDTTITNLEFDSTYYYAPVLYNHYSGYHYILSSGKAKSFVVKSPASEGYVDLGLSAKWAATNIGAEKYYDSGSGCNGGPEASSYITDDSRVPTKDEWQELLDKCTITPFNGKYYGILVESKVNGNAIFISHGDYWTNTCKYDDDSGVYYYLGTRGYFYDGYKPYFDYTYYRNHSYIRTVK